MPNFWESYLPTISADHAHLDLRDFVIRGTVVEQAFVICLSSIRPSSVNLLRFLRNSCMGPGHVSPDNFFFSIFTFFVILFSLAIFGT